MANAFKGWNVVAITCETASQANAISKELTARRALGSLPGTTDHTIFVGVSDPRPQTANAWEEKTNVVGSGGATLNALLAVAEQLSARRGTGTLDPTVLQDAHILIVHASTNYPVPAANHVGKAFSLLPAVAKGGGRTAPLVAKIDLIFEQLSRWVAGAAPGVWVSTAEFFLNLPNSQTAIAWPDGISCLTVPTPVALGKQHGLFQVDPKDNTVSDILYQLTDDQLKESGVISEAGLVDVVCEVTRFCANSAELLLGLYASYPLDGCTSYGHDAGGAPVKVNLYLDILAACFSDKSKYMAPKAWYPSYNKSQASPSESGRQRRPSMTMQTAVRELLWKTFCKTPLHAVYPPKLFPDASSVLTFVRTTEEYLSFITAGVLWQADSPSSIVDASRQSAARIQGGKVAEDSVVMNSLLGGCIVGPGSLVENSKLGSGWNIGKGSIVSGVEGSTPGYVPDNTVLQQCRLLDGRVVTVRYGVMDDWNCVPCSWMGELTDDLNIPGVWPEDLPESQRVLKYAKIFDTSDGEKLSLAECLRLADFGAEMHWRNQIRHLVDMETVQYSLSSSSIENTLCLIPVFARLALDRSAWQMLLSRMDIITVGFGQELNLVSRALASQADLLAQFAGVEGGLRSGPARNEAWVPALEKMKMAGQKRVPLSEAIGALADVRLQWLDTPDRLMRAARHYEAAAAVLISSCVSTCVEFFADPTLTEAAPVGTWVTANTPARIDLAGGWTDTPPVSYEYGGLVVNAAILVDKQYPIVCKARRTDQPLLNLTIRDIDGQGTTLTCRSLKDLADYTHPQAPAALLKTAVLCLRLVDLEDSRPLSEQLLANTGAPGLDLDTQSRLPTGSGLGGSSILGGALLYAMGEAVGRSYSRDALVHAVLHLEQMLTAGGGWQDQVGGLFGGVKACSSPAALPLQVKTEVLDISPEQCEQLSKHLVLCYTGKARLARNLLQGVLRRWFGRLPEVVETVSGLVSNAEAIQGAIASGDIEAFGACVSTYWSQKKKMAGSGVEPTVIARVLKAVAPLCAGASLAGAGGGGFILLVTHKADDMPALQKVLDSVQDAHTFTLHDCDIDFKGMAAVFE